MMIFLLVAMTGLEKCCIPSAYLQWLCHSAERPVARGPLVYFSSGSFKTTITIYQKILSQLESITLKILHLGIIIL